MSIFKFLLTFAISFLILSFPIKNKSLFLHIDESIRPHKAEMFKGLKGFGNSLLKSIDGLSEKILGKKFDLEIEQRTDSLRRSYAAPVRNTRDALKIKQTDERPKERYTQEEEEFLKTILRNSH